MKFIVFTLFFIATSNHIFCQETDCIDSIMNNITDVEYQELYVGKVFMKNAEWQEGYIIVNETDTLFGKVMLYSNGIHIRFKNASGEKKFRADKYKSFKYGDRFFRSKNFEGYPYNTELIENGRVCLYAYEQYSTYPGFSGDHSKLLYLEKGTDVFGPITVNILGNLNGKSWIYKCFEDCPELLLRLENKSLKFADLLNACKAYNCIFE